MSTIVLAASGLSRCASPGGTGGELATEVVEVGADVEVGLETSCEEATEAVCCCDGDWHGNVVCVNGQLTCGGMPGPFFGADCTRPCGPCGGPDGCEVETVEAGAEVTE